MIGDYSPDKVAYLHESTSHALNTAHILNRQLQGRPEPSYKSLFVFANILHNTAQSLRGNKNLEPPFTSLKLSVDHYATIDKVVGFARIAFRREYSDNIDEALEQVAEDFMQASRDLRNVRKLPEEKLKEMSTRCCNISSALGTIPSVIKHDGRGRSYPGFGTRAFG